MCTNCYTKEYEVRYYEMDNKKRILKSSLMNYFTDIATIHSIDRGVGIDHLANRGLGWIINKYHIEFYDQGHFRETLRVTTEAYGFKKYFAYRTFKVEGEKGNVIARAQALFMVIDLEKRKMTRIAQDIVNAYEVPEEKINRQLSFEKIKPIEEVQRELTFQIRASDIDTNGHVNNAKYFDWFIEAIPPEIIYKKSLKVINIDFIKECLYGDLVTSQVEVLGGEDSQDIKIIHRIINKDGKEITRAETFWGEE